MKIQGVIRKCVNGTWGIVHSYTRNPSGAPEKYFIHKNQLIDVAAAIDAGVRVSFEVGQPPRKGDLPPAINVEVVPTQSSPTPSTNDGGAK
jgi:hypothetical protein